MAEYYRHFRNRQVYRMIGIGTIEATGEEAVVYQAMYGERRIWIRPKTNFLVMWTKSRMNYHPFFTNGQKVG